MLGLFLGNGKMKKLLNTIRIILIVVLLLVLAASILFDIFAEGLVKVGVETAATKQLNVKVTLADVDLSLMAGGIKLQDLVISNPPGYQHENLLQLKKAKVNVDIGSLLGDIVKIQQIKLDGIDLTIEQRGLSSNNLQDIIKSIPKKPKEKAPAEEKPKAEEEPKPSKKLQIEELEITNVKVNVKLLPIPGKTDTITMELAPIRMTNLGEDGKMDIAELSAKILLAITEGITEQGVGILPADILDTTKSALGDTLGLGKGATEESKKIIEEGKKVIEGFKDLFEKKE